MAIFSINNDNSHCEINLEVSHEGDDVFLTEIGEDDGNFGLIGLMLSPTTARRIASDLLRAAHNADNGGPY